MTTATAETTTGQQTSDPGGAPQTSALGGEQGQPSEPTKTAGEAGKAGEQVNAGEVGKDTSKETGKAKEPAGAPERYDLKAPEGSLLQTADVEQAMADAKALGLTNDEAQELLEDRGTAVQSFADRQKAEVAQIHADWRKEAEADQEIGGTKFKESVELGKRAIERFGDAEAKQVLNASGLGNHRALIRIFSRIGKAIQDDTLVHATTQTTQEPDAAALLYPSHHQGAK